MELIPAIDIIDGKCVRLTQGDYTRKVIYNEDPLEAAKQFEATGIRRLHLVDLDGAKAGKIINYNVLEKIAAKTRLIIDFGGGIKSNESIRTVFESGAAIATIGSIAVKDKELFFSWIEKYGKDKILLGADVKDEKIAVSGWLETTELTILEFIRTNLEKGVGSIFCTDVSKDGLLMGPGIELYKKILEEFPSLDLIASGGVSSVVDLEQIRSIGCSGAIVGKAIYEGRISLVELKRFIG
jgi:phosphoribosylformimino-5-aminoimidazole carboxamide ribotide isomerase